MFRGDHGNYPTHLSQLVPEYVDVLPLDPYSRQPFQYQAAGLDLPCFGRTTTDTPIEAGTPLFWSVGAANARLWQMEDRTFVPDENDPDGALREVQQTGYVLMGHDLEWLGESGLAFSLPK
jgi:hypothetical protein